MSSTNPSNPPSTSGPTIYFGYGSNLWLHQMRTRCPSSTYLGVARLPNYRWIINDRGYANVVEISPSSQSLSSQPTSQSDYTKEVYGLVYALTPTDESRLDVNEGVPIAYTKEHLPCDFWSCSDSSPVDVGKKPTETKDMLVYIDRNRTTPSEPKEEYIYRMNCGIDDAIAMGLPSEYVEQVMRKFIPAEEKSREKGSKNKGRNREVESKALRQAMHFKDESGVF
ncbi:hypothetical protein K458DRAFT_30851 [Lentithecium fluviatile CBS 122367]|uniref:gamma-glutamylcyclotransferase n=1 Tax=Lentithecium fluviatile CBS 122367 TaxID=1168545 RepID=A0A6G1J2A5_9PLEO|nr:hypothetical protein K458DRAFT_30851 [Lentithecium fluviatile CBS 122367]